VRASRRSPQWKKWKLRENSDHSLTPVQPSGLFLVAKLGLALQSQAFRVDSSVKGNSGSQAKPRCGPLTSSRRERDNFAQAGRFVCLVERDHFPVLFRRDPLRCLSGEATGYVKLNDFRHESPLNSVPSNSSGPLVSDLTLRWRPRLLTT